MFAAVVIPLPLVSLEGTAGNFEGAPTMFLTEMIMEETRSSSLSLSSGENGASNQKGAPVTLSSSSSSLYY